MAYLSPDDLIAVAEDLEHLREDWGPAVGDPEARRGSAVLRRLLVESIYGQAWRSIGFAGEPRVVAVAIESHVGHVPLSDVVMATAGGVRFPSWEFGGACFVKSSKKPPEASKPLTPEGFPGEREYSMSEYLASTGAIALRRRASRRDIIKYFANIKGGVHLGRTEKKREAKLLKRMAEFENKFKFKFPVSGSLGPLLEREGLLVELICIAQAVGRSRDAATFIKAARRGVGDGE